MNRNQTHFGVFLCLKMAAKIGKPLGITQLFNVESFPRPTTFESNCPPPGFATAFQDSSLQQQQRKIKKKQQVNGLHVQV